LSFALIALSKGLVEPLLQLGVCTPKISCLVIDAVKCSPRRALLLTGRYFDRHAPPAEKGVRLDHLLVETVKSASGFLGDLTG